MINGKCDRDRIGSTTKTTIKHTHTHTHRDTSVIISHTYTERKKKEADIDTYMLYCDQHKLHKPIQGAQSNETKAKIFLIIYQPRQKGQMHKKNRMRNRLALLRVPYSKFCQVRGPTQALGLLKWQAAAICTTT